MKKSQRLRLAELLAKKQNGTLVAEEIAELQRLEALASQHPDAAKDEDDTKALTASEFLKRLTSAFKDKADLAAKNQAQAAVLAVLATFLGLKVDELMAKKPEEITAALNAKCAAKPDAAAPTAEQLTAATTAKTNAEALTQVYVQGLSAAKITVAPKDSTVGITAADVTGAIAATIDLRAGEKLGDLGFPQSGIPSAKKDNAGGGDTADVLARYAAITDPSERASFYAVNIAPLLEPKRN
jgi:hypothetical protein